MTDAIPSTEPRYLTMKPLLRECIEHGRKLLAGKRMYPDTKRFGRWIAANGLAEGQWRHSPRRSEAMRMAKILEGDPSAFDYCPHSRESNALKWWLAGDVNPSPIGYFYPSPIGYVYVLDVGNGLVKIGRTVRNPLYRARQWRLPLIASAAVAVANLVAAESALHAQFASERVGAYELFRVERAAAINALERLSVYS